MALRPAALLLAYTYIDILTEMTRQQQMGKDANSIFEDLEALEPDWYNKLDDAEAKAALKTAGKKIIHSSGAPINIKVPGEVAL